MGYGNVSKAFTKKITTKQSVITRIRRRALKVKNILVQISTSHNGYEKT